MSGGKNCSIIISSKIKVAMNIRHDLGRAHAVLQAHQLEPFGECPVSVFHG